MPAVSLDDIKGFRQLHTRCPGHPEHGWTAGVETTTGPLGQGVANSVGMAMAEKWLAARYNRPGFELFNYRVYAICGDGCMMEGISGEAGSLAGHLKLDNLVWLYDNNHITIEGKTDLAYNDDAAVRYLGYGWNVLRVGDANDLDAIEHTLRTAEATKGRPTLIIVDSHIGWGAPTRQDTKEAHGEPLGDEEIKKTKRFYGWPEDAKFLVPEGVMERFQQGVGARGREANAAWKKLFEAYAAKYPTEAAELRTLFAGGLPDGWDKGLTPFPTDAKGAGSRVSGGKVLNAIAQRVPWMIGGAADLAPSTKTLLTFDGAGSFQGETPAGRNLHFGIREHAMGAIVNGLALSGLRAYGSGFLIFSDYMRGSIRLSSIMELPVMYIFTHDSIYVGESTSITADEATTTFAAGSKLPAPCQPPPSCTTPPPCTPDASIDAPSRTSIEPPSIVTDPPRLPETSMRPSTTTLSATSRRPRPERVIAVFASIVSDPPVRTKKSPPSRASAATSRVDGSMVASS